jgi:hypothetical protein
MFVMIESNIIVNVIKAFNKEKQQTNMEKIITIPILENIYNQSQHIKREMQWMFKIIPCWCKFNIEKPLWTHNFMILICKEHEIFCKD